MSDQSYQGWLASVSDAIIESLLEKCLKASIFWCAGLWLCGGYGLWQVGFLFFRFGDLRTLSLWTCPEAGPALSECASLNSVASTI